MKGNGTNQVKTFTLCPTSCRSVNASYMTLLYIGNYRHTQCNHVNNGYKLQVLNGWQSEHGDNSSMLCVLSARGEVLWIQFIRPDSSYIDHIGEICVVLLTSVSISVTSSKFGDFSHSLLPRHYIELVHQYTLTVLHSYTIYFIWIISAQCDIFASALAPNTIALHSGRFFVLCISISDR